MLKNRSKEHLELLEKIWFKEFDSSLILEINNYRKNKNGKIFINQKSKEITISTKFESKIYVPHSLMDEEHYIAFINELLYLAIEKPQEAINYFHATFSLMELILVGARMVIIEPYLEDRFNIIFSEEIKNIIKNYYK
ncbi:MAG: hypothetical protein ACRC4T_15675 [Cetobacterium sp.]